MRVGDKLKHCPVFGIEEPTVARIDSMELTETPRSKYGESVEECSLEQIQANLVLFMLDNGHWCYSEQVCLD